MTGYKTLSQTLRSHIDSVHHSRKLREEILAEIVIALRKELGIAEELFQFRSFDDATHSSDLYASMKHTDNESAVVVVIEINPDVVNGKQAVFYCVRIAVGSSPRTGTTIYFADGQTIKGDPTSVKFVENAAKTIGSYITEMFGAVLIGAHHPAQLWFEKVTE